MGLEVLDAALLQPEGNVFGPASRVREDEGRAMLVDQLAEEVIHPSIRDLHRYGGFFTHPPQKREGEGPPPGDPPQLKISGPSLFACPPGICFLPHPPAR